MQNKVFINADGIIELDVTGDQTEFSFRKLYEDSKPFIRELRKAGQPVHAMIDMTREGNYTINSNKAALDILEDADYDRLAIYGSPYEEVAHLVVAALGKSDVTKVFEDRQAAIDWLRSQTTTEDVVKK